MTEDDFLEDFMKEEENKIPNKEQKSGTRHKQKHVWSGGFELHTRRV